MSQWRDLMGPDGPFADRFRTGRLLVIAGVIGVLGAVVAGVVAWVMLDRARETVTVSIEPMARMVGNLSETIEASQTILERTTETIESIETATRSTVRTLTSVGEVLTETATLAEGEVADSLDSAVETLPGLISTGRVVDRTMRALSLLGVDYDPDLPLDVALGELHTSLAPLPEQVRRQVDLIDTVNDDLEEIADDGRELSAVLLEARLEMLETERVLASAIRNAASAAESVDAIGAEVDRVGTLGRVLVVAASIALLAVASAPLMLGLYLQRTDGQPSGQAAT